MSNDTLLFDLDGTLTDSRPGIVAGLRHTLSELGHPVDPAADLTWAIGPPTTDVFARLLAPFADPRIDEAVRIYRARYDAIGWRQNAPYAGIAEVLAAFASGGITLYVATSKRVDFARRILEHFGFARYFAQIYGMEMDGTLAHKPELISHLLRTHAIEPARAMMIGDRSYDIAGAHANGLRAIGVTWGYGSAGELAQADALAHAPADLPAAVEKARALPDRR